MGVTQRMALSMIRGDTLTIGFEIDNLSEDLDEVYFSCRTAFGASDYIFQVSLTGQSVNGSVTKESDGKYRVRVAPIATANLTPGQYVYDLEFEYGDDVLTPLIGTLKIDYGVTEGE